MIGWLTSYKKEWLRPDVVAGMTTAAVVVPKAMGYAAIAGLPLVVGLTTSMVALAVYAATGTSRVLSVTTTTTIAILTAGALAEAAPGADAAGLVAAACTLTLLVGGFLVLGGVARLGVLANLISDSVLTGFKAGIGLVIVLDQLPKLLGVKIAKAGFFRDLAAVAGKLAATHLPTLLLALGMLVLMLGIERFAPRLPAPLITVGVGIALSAVVGLERFGISLVGAVEGGLPPFAVPDLSLAGALWPAAAGIALMSFVETAAVGRAFIPRHGRPPAANRELVATGLANVVGGFLQGMPSGGGASQTLVNYSAGARSQAAGLVTGIVVLATLLVLAPFFGLMPNATLAAVVILASVGLISPGEFRSILRIRAMEFRWALAAMVGVLVFGTLKGVLVAVLLSLVALVVRASLHPLLVLGRKPGTNVFRPRSSEHPEDETLPGLLLLRPAGGLSFANAPRLGEELRTLLLEFSPRVVALDLSAVPDLEYTALRMLSDGEEKLREAGSALWLVALNPEVLRVVQRSSLGERLGREGLIFNLEQAVEKYRKQFAG